MFTKSGLLWFIIKAGYENFIGLPKGKGSKKPTINVQYSAVTGRKIYMFVILDLPKAILVAPRGQLQRGNGFRFLWFVFITLSLQGKGTFIPISPISLQKIKIIVQKIMEFSI